MDPPTKPSKSPNVVAHPDGSFSTLEPMSPPPGTRTDAGFAPTAQAPAPAPAPVPMQPFVPAPAYGAGFAVPRLPVPAPSVIVACPRCQTHLQPPVGAPIFACPCGQQMRPPPPQVPYAYAAYPNGGMRFTMGAGTYAVTTPVIGGPGMYAGQVITQPQPYPGYAPAPAPAPAPVRVPVTAPLQAAPRIITCASCRCALQTTSDITICGRCGYRNTSGHVYSGATSKTV